MDHGFTFLAWLAPHHVAEVYWQTVYAALSGVLLIAVGLVWGRAQARAGTSAVIPEPKITGRNFGDIVAGALDGMVLSTVGPNGRKYTPFFGTIFLFIFFNNALGLIPGFLPATSDISMNFGIAIVVFVVTHIVGLREHGGSYGKQFLGPILAMAPLMLPIELISHIARPVSLSIRLFGNMMGDHTVLSIFGSLVPLFVPVIFLFIGLFVCLMQAYVFMMLSMIYISMAESHDH